MCSIFLKSLKVTLKAHMRNVHPTQEFTCEHCHVTFNHEHILKYHIESEHPTKKVRRKISSKKSKAKNRSFKPSRRITRAKRSRIVRRSKKSRISATLNHACELCAKKFDCKSRLRSHFVSRHEPHVYQECEHCHKKFPFKVSQLRF